MSGMKKKPKKRKSKVHTLGRYTVREIARAWDRALAGQRVFCEFQHSTESLIFAYFVEALTGKPVSK